MLQPPTYKTTVPHNLSRFVVSTPTHMSAAQRIIAHMNDGHQLALADYIVVYGNRPATSFVHSSVRISDVNEELLTLEYVDVATQKKHTLELDWDSAREDQHLRVTEYKDIKEKLVSMAKYAANQQGYSHRQITEVVPPPPSGLALYLLFAAFAAGLYDLAKFKLVFANDAIFQSVAQYFPQAVWAILDFTGKHVRTIFGVILVAHVAEVLLFTVPQTHKYRVPPLKRLAWGAMHLVEGFFVMNRFKRLIKEQE